MQAVPEVRKNIFLVTKDSPRDPSQMMGMLDQRLASLKADYVDLFLIHALGDHHGADEAIAMPKSRELREAIEAIQKPGQATVAGKFEPLKKAELDGLHRAFMASNPSLCPDCDGRCARAGGTEALLGDLTRYLTYHERHGARSEARRLFAELPESARDWKGADL